MSKKYVIVGGVAGGATAAARLRRLDESAEVILLEKGPNVSFANCGLPYYIGGVITNREELLVMSPDKFRGLFAVDVRVDSEVVHIDTQAKVLTIRNAGKEYEESYDSLLLSPGAQPLRPPIPGIENENIVSLRNVPDADRLFSLAQQRGKAGRAVVVGGGFIGVEVAENLRARGLTVTIVEAAPHILAPFDTDMIGQAEAELRQNGIALILQNGVKEFQHQADGTVTVELGDGQRLPADFVVLAIGVRPDTAFLQDSGILLTDRGHIVVDKFMRTNAPDVYAVGDAVMTIDHQTGNKMALPLAGPANRQGRLAADNIAGLQREYHGVQGSSILKVFSLIAAATGKNERTLRKEGLVYGKDYRFTITYPASHAGYYPGAMNFALKVIFRLSDGRVLGAQAVGQEGVDKRIDVLAAIIRQQGTIEDLMDLELSYAPPFSSAKDPVNMAGYVADNILQGLADPIRPEELQAMTEKNMLKIDVRPPIMYERGHLPGFINIPAPKLRNQLGTLDKDCPIIISCQVGMNGYFMERMLKQHGFNARNLMGGFTYAAPVLGRV